MEYSKNERAGQLLGFRQKGQPVLEPSELGYRCPICKNPPIVDHEYDERLTWSEYNSFLWCSVCNRDFPSCLCLNDIGRAIEVFLDSVEDAVRHSYKKSYKAAAAVVLKGFIVEGQPDRLTDQGVNMIKRICKALLRIPVILLCLIIHPLDEELAHDLRKWAGLDW